MLLLISCMSNRIYAFGLVANCKAFTSRAAGKCKQLRGAFGYACTCMVIHRTLLQHVFCIESVRLLPANQCRRHVWAPIRLIIPCIYAPTACDAG